MNIGTEKDLFRLHFCHFSLYLEICYDWQNFKSFLPLLLTSTMVSSNYSRCGSKMCVKTVKGSMGDGEMALDTPL